MRHDLFNYKSATSDWTALLCRDTDRPWRLEASRGDDTCIGWASGVTQWWVLQIGYWTISLERLSVVSEFDAAQALSGH